jgi:uncharacterized protein YggE
MGTKQRGRAGGPPPARPEQDAGTRASEEITVQQNIQTEAISPFSLRTQQPSDGITVTGEAIRRLTPESAEFLIEITASAPTASQALRDNQTKTKQVTQAVGPLGVQAPEIQSISLNVYNLYSPLMAQMPQVAPQPLPVYGGVAPGGMAPQVGQLGFSSHVSPGQQEMAFGPFDLQYGAYLSRNTLRITVREAAKVGEVVDAIVKSGATVLGGFSLRVSDEAAARRATLEAAGKDARAKAEALAASTGRQLGDAIAIAEDFVASNGTYMALRAALPLAFGAGAPQTAGELEYYARVSARFAVT